MFHRLLVCTEFSDGVDRLAYFTPSLAKAGVEQIVFLHSVPLREGEGIPRVDSEKVAQARKMLEAATHDAPTDVDVKVEVESGRPIDTILKTATRYQTDLIILGMPIRTLLTEKLFGSTTMGLCQRITVPLMILRPQLISTYTSEELSLRCQHLFRYLLIPYDGSDSANYLIDRIKTIAQNGPTQSLERLHLCWVVDDVGRRGVPRDYQIDAARESLASVKADLDPLNVFINPIEVRQGNAVVEVLESAKMSDVSAIAVSSGSLGKILEWSSPSFAGELLRRSWHPLIYFPPKRD